MYTYSCRPGYKSDKLLLEFVQNAEKDSFIGDLLDALADLKPVAQKMTDLWVNDEIIMEIQTAEGAFSLSRDIWGLAFIMSEQQELIRKMDSLLAANPSFLKTEVDFKDYQ